MRRAVIGRHDALQENWEVYARPVFREVQYGDAEALFEGADLEGEGKKLPLEALRFIHENKTAALLTTSLKLGGMSANATPEQLAALRDFGMATGLAFQIIDDILDVTQTSEKLGKSAGKDLASEKSTYPALIGLEASRDEAHRLTQVSHDVLGIFGESGVRLRELADYLLARDY